MKVGSLIRANNSGLGTLAREFYDNGIIHKGLYVPNQVYKDFPDRFPTFKQGINSKLINWLLDDIDVLLCFENAYRWGIINEAKRKGIKTILMPMHEGLREQLPYHFDLYLAPSSEEMNLGLSPIERINVPVNTDRLKWRERKTAKVFVHNSGHGGIGMRNGTMELIEAMKYVKSDIKLIIRSQYHKFVTEDPRIEYRYENLLDYWDIWKEGDVFIFPEKFNGLSLPVQEAFASGLCVMTTDKEAFDFLPKKPLIPPSGFRNYMVARIVEGAEHDPKIIAQKIDEIANTDISEYSRAGREWALKNNWQSLKSKYIELCQ